MAKDEKQDKRAAQKAAFFERSVLTMAPTIWAAADGKTNMCEIVHDVLSFAEILTMAMFPTENPQPQVGDVVGEEPPVQC